jgi:hypothetical protein
MYTHHLNGELLTQKSKEARKITNDSFTSSQIVKLTKDMSVCYQLRADVQERKQHLQP